MSAKTKAWADVLIDQELRAVAFAFPATVFLALFSTATDQDSNGTEITTGSPSRQPITFTDPAGGNTTASAADVSFANMPTVTAGWGAFMTAASGGLMMYQGALTVAKTFGGGETFLFEAGTVTLEMN